MADKQQRDDNVHIENDEEEGSVDESEEEDSDIEDDELEVHELDKDIFERLKKNDPAVAILSIDLNCNNDKSFFNSIDWKVDGDCIASNTHVKRLNIHIVASSGENYILGGQGNELPTRQQLQDFFSCIYRNQSIETVLFSSIQIHEFGAALIEGLQGHPSLTGLEIEFGRLGSAGCTAIGKVLKHPQCKLRDLQLPYCNIDDSGLGALCDGLLVNNTLRSISLYGNRDITSVGWIALSNVIRDSNCKLVNLDLSSGGLNDDSANILGTSLRESSVKDLNLSMNHSITNSGWQTLSNHLSQTSTKSLDISSNNMDDDGVAELASIDTLKSLDLNYSRLVTPPGWRSFFNSLQARGALLVKLNISYNHIGNGGIQILGSLLSSMNTLQTLHMGRMAESVIGSNKITSQGCQTLFTTLQESSLNLVELYLGGNEIDDEGIRLLAPLLSSMSSSLKCLILGSNRSISSVGWRALTELLQSPNCTLERLDASESKLNDDTVVAFTNALSHNKTLKQLDLYDCFDDDEVESINERGWEAVSSLLCNKTSIMDTYNSNHTLQDLGCDPSYSSLDEGLELPDDLILYLELNRNEDKVEVARQKILQTQFSDNDASNIQELLDMELEVMPTAIEWIGRPTADWKGTNVSGLTLMYNLMRRVPNLFDSSAQKKLSKGKRKRA